MSEAVDLLLGELAAQPPGDDDADVVDRDAHHRGLAGGEPEDADPADLELTRAAHLLDLAVAGAQALRVGLALGADDDPDWVPLARPGKRRLRWVDDDRHLPAAKPDARVAVIGQFHWLPPVCRLGRTSRFRPTRFERPASSRPGRR